MIYYFILNKRYIIKKLEDNFDVILLAATEKRIKIIFQNPVQTKLIFNRHFYFSIP